mmetsp:Transcript_27464/g.62171  ORF Transcript_27464/g.62171 Transcript_27464/m.62171 type:complete len:183 (-) Transcript_27464:288-836(-)
MFLKSMEDASGWKGDNLGAAAAVFVVLLASGFPTMSFLDMACSVHIRFWLGFILPAIGTLVAPAAATWIFLCYPALSKRSRLTTVLGTVAVPTLVHLVLAYGVRHHAMMLAQDLLVPDCSVGPFLQGHVSLQCVTTWTAGRCNCRMTGTMPKRYCRHAVNQLWMSATSMYRRPWIILRDWEL